ncbi:MAG: T9SS type A sorting domain-containing protein [Flavobacteriales bacterium]
MKKILLFSLFLFISTFSYAQIISAVVPNQAKEGETLTVTLVGHGTNFTAGVNGITYSYYTGGTGTTYINGQNVTVTSDTSVKVTVTLPINVVHGPYLDFKINTSANGILSKNSAFTIKSSAMSIASFSPAQGHCGDNLTVTIVGENTKFTNGISNFTLYGGSSPTGTTIVGQNFNVVSDSLFTADISVPLNAYIGNYSMAFFNPISGNPGYHFTVSNIFSVTANPQGDVLLKYITPSHAVEGTSLTVSVVGQNTKFTQGVNSLKISAGSDIYASNIVVQNDTLFKADFAIPANASNGYFTVVANTVNDGNLNLVNAFRIDNDVNNDVLIKSLTPNQADQGDVLSVTIVGQNTTFNNGVKQIRLEKYTNNGSPTTTIIYGQNISATNDQSVTASFSIPANAPVGYYNAYVIDTTGGGTLLKYDAFTVNVDQDIPSIEPLAPFDAYEGSSLTVTVVGNHTQFTKGVSSVRVQYSLGSPTTTVYGSNISVLNDSILLADLDLPSNMQLGNYYCFVNTTEHGELSRKDAFRIMNDPTNDVLLKSISPAYADQGEALTVTIVGQNTSFTNGVSNILLAYTNGSATTYSGQNITVVNDNEVKTTFTFPGNAPVGAYALSLTSSGKTLYLSSSFVVSAVNNTPVIKSISKNDADKGDSFTLTVKGKNTNFTAGITSVNLNYNASGLNINQAINGTNITVVNDTTLAIDFTVPTDAYLGQYVLDISGAGVQNLSVNLPQITIGAPGNNYSAVINNANDGDVIYLFNTSGDTIAIDTLDANLYFDFSNVADGDYTIGISGVSGKIPFKASASAAYVGNVLYINSNGLEYITVGVKPPKEVEHSFVVFPNPANDYLTVRFESDLTNGSVTIYNAFGQLVFQQSISNENTLTLDISTLSSGTYYLSLMDETSMKTLPFVVVK